MEYQSFALLLFHPVFDLDEFLFWKLNIVNLSDIGCEVVNQVILGMIPVNMV